jgi:hypothetical protein
MDGKNQPGKFIEIGFTIWCREKWKEPQSPRLCERDSTETTGDESHGYPAHIFWSKIIFLPFYD